MQDTSLRPRGTKVISVFMPMPLGKFPQRHILYLASRDMKITCALRTFFAFEPVFISQGTDLGVNR